MRRYKSGENKTYDDIYSRIRVQSWILNGGVRDANLFTAGRLSDLNSIKSTRLELVGNESEQYFDPDRKKWTLAKIPLYKFSLKNIDEEFNQYKQEQVNLGFEVPTELPEHLHIEKIGYLARLDVMEDEVALLDKLIREYSESEKQVKNLRMLKYGLIQSGQGCPLKEIDGQKVSVHSKGFLIIDEPDSPYDGMAVADYRKLANDWRASVGSLKACQTFKLKDLPVWPTGVKKHITR